MFGRRIPMAKARGIGGGYFDKGVSDEQGSDRQGVAGENGLRNAQCGLQMAEWRFFANSR